MALNAQIKCGSEVLILYTASIYFDRLLVIAMLHRRVVKIIIYDWPHFNPAEQFKIALKDDRYLYLLYSSNMWTSTRKNTSARENSNLDIGTTVVENGQ